MYWVKVSVVAHQKRETAKTYCTKWPENAVIDEEPGLFAESSQVLALRDSSALSDGRQNVFHAASSETSEKNDEECDEVGIVKANGVVSGRRIVVGVLEELTRVLSCFGNECVGEEQQAKKIERQSCKETISVSGFPRLYCLM